MDEWFATVNLKESFSVAIDANERIHPCVLFPSVQGKTGRHTVSIQLKVLVMHGLMAN